MKVFRTAPWRIALVPLLFLYLGACGEGYEDKDAEDSAFSALEVEKEQSSASDQQSDTNLTRNYTVDQFYLSHLQVHHPAEETWSKEVDEHTYYEHHPVVIEFGVTAKGNPIEFNMFFGLMEKLSTTNPTDADYAALKHCSLGSTVVSHSGGTELSENHYSATFTIPAECVEGLAAGGSRTFNVYVSGDTEGQVKEGNEDPESGSVLVLSELEKAGDRNKLCKDSKEAEGCVYDLIIKPSHGLNLAVLSLKKESSVAVLSSSTSDHSDATNESGTTQAEFNEPFLQVTTEVAVYGAEGHDETSSNAIDGKTVSLKYAICPGADIRPDSSGALSHTCADGTDWAALTIYDQDNAANAASGHLATLPITSLVASTPTYFHNKLYAESTTRTLLSSGGAWSNFVYFAVKACVSSTDITEQSTTSGQTYDTTLSDNCQYQHVTLTRPVATDHSANTYSFNRSWSNSYGSSKTVGIKTAFSTNNTLNLSGAVSATSGDLDTIGWLKKSVAHAHANAGAYVAVTGSYIDLQQKLIGLTLFSYQKTIPEVDYSKTYELSKEACATFQYGILILSLNVSICAKGSAGFTAGLAITAKEGNNSTFSSSTKIGDITVTFTPKASFTAETSAYVSVAVARGGVEGSVTLVEISLPVSSTLNWGLTSLSPTTLAFKGRVTMDLVIETLKGSLVAFGDLRSVKWCSKSFKIWGKRKHISYPCGFSWNRKLSYNIVSWSGKTYTYGLLNRYKTLTLSL